MGTQGYQFQLSLYCLLWPKIIKTLATKHRQIENWYLLIGLEASLARTRGSSFNLFINDSLLLFQSLRSPTFVTRGCGQG